MVVYRRPDNKRTFIVKRFGRTFEADNKWIAPYNPYLSLKLENYFLRFVFAILTRQSLYCRYQCHINVELCNSVRAIKYLHKYVYKGPDRVMVKLSNVQHQDGSDITPSTSTQQPKEIDEIKVRQFLNSLNENYVL